MASTFSKKPWALSHLFLLGLFVLVIFQFLEITDSRLQLSFLDIGQGDATLIETPEFKNILIDAGPDSTVVNRLSEELSFFDKTIDLFVMTHPDRDHFAGTLDVLEHYKIQTVLMTGVVSEDSLFEAFLNEVKARQIGIIVPTADQDIQISSDLYLDIIFPFKNQNFFGQKVKEKNDTSVTLRLRRRMTGGWEDLAMLPGDAGQGEEREILLSGQDVQSPLLKLGHHGSKTSTSQPWLNAIRPRTAVVSAGRDNSYGHPHQEVLNRLSGLKVQNTAKEGTIHFVF